MAVVPPVPLDSSTAKAGVDSMIQFLIPGIPIAQPRQRHAMIHGCIRNYTPKKHPVTAFKASARLAARQAYQGPPLEGPIELRVLFLFPRPARLRWKKRPMPREWHTGRPDCENIIKSFQDALTGVLWVDDAQVCQLRAQKLYCRGGEQPGTWVMIEKAQPFVDVMIRYVRSEYA